MDVSDAIKPRALEDESELSEHRWSERHWQTRLKRMLADAMPDNAALKGHATKDY